MVFFLATTLKKCRFWWNVRKTVQGSALPSVLYNIFTRNITTNPKVTIAHYPEDIVLISSGQSSKHCVSTTRSIFQCSSIGTTAGDWLIISCHRFRSMANQSIGKMMFWNAFSLNVQTDFNAKHKKKEIVPDIVIVVINSKI